MKIEFDIDLSELDQPELNDGQVTVKLPKAIGEQFKILNIKHNKQLSKYMRKFALTLITKIESRDKSAS